jgi:polysaccharide export outer membrane protein
LTRTVPVRPDGKISLPLLNDVQAAGLSAQELRDVLAQKLGAYMPNPEVSVIVTGINSFKVSLIGEVARPGRLELRSWTTVLDALALAGGFTQFASRSKIVILQPDGKGMKRIPFNYNKALDGEQENFYLRNGDIILVP